MTRPLTGVTEMILQPRQPTLRELQSAFNGVNHAWNLRPSDIGRIRLNRVFFTGGWRITQLDEYGADNFVTGVLTRQEAMTVMAGMMPGGQMPTAEPVELPAVENYRDSDYETGVWEVHP